MISTIEKKVGNGGERGVHALVAMPEPFVLVLDDYHLIQAPLIYELMDRLWWPIYPPR